MTGKMLSVVTPIFPFCITLLFINFCPYNSELRANGMGAVSFYIGRTAYYVGYGKNDMGHKKFYVPYRLSYVSYCLWHLRHAHSQNVENTKTTVFALIIKR